MSKRPKVQTCRICGCTDNDCARCIKRTGAACFWVGPNLCSACALEGSAGEIPRTIEEQQTAMQQLIDAVAMLPDAAAALAGLMDSFNSQARYYATLAMQCDSRAKILRVSAEYARKRSWTTSSVQARRASRKGKR